jgi:hypothetical protein
MTRERERERFDDVVEEWLRDRRDRRDVRRTQTA